MTSLRSCPPEIIKLIVDELATSGRGPWKNLKRDLKSCSRASRLFLPHTRTHIFHSISIRSSGRNYSTSAARRLVQAIEWAPDIAHSIRTVRLDLQLDTFFFNPPDATNTLLSLLTRVQDLTVVLNTPGSRWLVPWEGIPNNVCSTLRKWLQSPGFKRLKLMNVQFPLAGEIERSHGLLTGLEELHLTDSHVYFYNDGSDESVDIDEEPLRPPIPLKSLSLDCCNRSADIAAVENDEQDDAVPPLASLHPSSHQSLRHLTIHLMHYVDEIATITHTGQYHGICGNNDSPNPSESILTPFRNLETFKFSLILNGQVEYLETTDNWTSLDRVLNGHQTSSQPTTAFPALNAVEIDIEIVVYEPYELKAAEELREKAAEKMRTKWFPGLDKRSKEGTMTLKTSVRLTERRECYTEDTDDEEQ
ncbi:hypothetical protein FA15DRAFT_652778 [Coprinopsis marcescibilis]|uniref:Uncharacterized protein n=1 Tax=Coprinopsis marcescibilis TaxID=230819 RepID=A0A5C3LIY9_COPMA|nr:hypothetical protein FA15DRAFT_652778 [Coprinopsis marcescibilis]